MISFYNVNCVITLYYVDSKSLKGIVYVILFSAFKIKILLVSEIVQNIKIKMIL